MVIVNNSLNKNQQQCWNNFTTALMRYGLDDYCNLLHKANKMKEDRIIIVCVGEIEQFIDSLSNFAKDPIILKKAHQGAYASWREKVTLYSMHLCLGYYDGYHILDVDCDYGRPFYDIVGWSVHAAEVIYNKISKSKTNPQKVCEVWNKRGYNIPLIA